MNISLVTVATDWNDCVDRYVSSCKTYGFNPQILGLNKEWRGGNMAAGIGGGQKVNLLREYLKDKPDGDIFIFTDSYDVIANDSLTSMMDTYNLHFKDTVVFGAEATCWPDRSLASIYPSTSSKLRFLNSGNFMGPCCKIRDLLTHEINDHDDDQLYYTRRFLESIKSENRVHLDYDQRLFMCLNDCPCEIDPDRLCVTTTNSVRPAFVHGNGPPSVKHRLSSLSNYVLPQTPLNFDGPLPTVTLVFHEVTTPKKECIDALLTLTGIAEVLYVGKSPDSRISEKWKCKSFEEDAITNVIVHAEGDLILYVSSRAIIHETDMIRLLLLNGQNFSAKSPLLTSKHSNFMSDGSHETNLDIVNRRRTGFFNVPYVWHIVLVPRTVMIRALAGSDASKVDSAFCAGMFRINRFLFVCNTHEFGTLQEC